MTRRRRRGGGGGGGIAKLKQTLSKKPKWSDLKANHHNWAYLFHVGSMESGQSPVEEQSKHRSKSELKGRCCLAWRWWIQTPKEAGRKKESNLMTIRRHREKGRQRSITVITSSTNKVSTIRQSILKLSSLLLLLLSPLHLFNPQLSLVWFVSDCTKRWKLIYNTNKIQHFTQKKYDLSTTGKFRARKKGLLCCCLVCCVLCLFVWLVV